MESERVLDKINLIRDQNQERMFVQHSEFDTNSLQILPKRNQLRPLNTMGLDSESFRTNCYEIQVTQKSLFLYQYHIVTDPVIPADSTKVWYKLVKNIELKLQKWIGLISHRSNTLWGNKYLKGQTLDLVWISKYKTKSTDDTDLMETQSFTSSSHTLTESPSQTSMFSLKHISQSQVSKIQSESQQLQKDSKAKYKETETKYRVSIKLTNKLDLKSLLTDEAQKGKIIQIINIKIKDKLQSMGYLELGKGRFYEKSKFQQDYVQEIGLQVLRGFRFSLMSLPNNRLCLQIDPCTRILQSTNLLEVIQNMGKQAAFRLKGVIVISRYGNYKTYKIDTIEYRRNPASFFYIHQVRKGKKPGEQVPKIKKTYAQYFKEAYGITVNNMKQPLVKILQNPIKIIKREKIREKRSYIYLIPELLSMTGMTQRQKNDKNAMKVLAPYTKLTPKARFIESQKMIHQIQSQDRLNPNQQNKEDFSMIRIREPTIVRGYQLNPVYVTLKDTQKVQEGQFNIRQPLLKPAKFEDWIIFCSNGTKPEKIKEFIQLLEKSSKELGITLKDPFMNVINYSEQDRDFISKQTLWVASLEKELEEGKSPPQIIVFYLQSYEESFYSVIKREVINRYGMASQVVKASTFQKQNGGLSIATGIIVQMNQKIGNTVWKVERNHPQFKEKTFQVFSTLKKPKAEQYFNQSMISETSSKKSRNSDKNRKYYENQRKDKHKKEKKDKKKKHESHKTELQSNDKTQQQSSNELSISLFSKHGDKTLQVEDLSQSVSLPSNLKQLCAEVSSIQVLPQNIQTSNESMLVSKELKVIEHKDSSQLLSADSPIHEVDESSQIMERSKVKQKKEKKDKKQKKEKKDKKKYDFQKNQEKVTKITKEQPDQSLILQENSQVQPFQQKESQPKIELSKSQASQSDKSDKSGKQKKQKKEKKQKKDNKENKEKKENNHSKKVQLAPQEKRKTSTTCYEDILIKKQQKKMAQAKKKVIDEKTRLQLTSELQIACAGFSSSTSSANGKFTISFVGTANKEQTQIYTHCRYGMRRKNYLPDLEFQVIFNYWLRTYYEKSLSILDGVEKHLMPSVLIIYREGLSEDQLKKQIYREVRILKKVIREKVPKALNYDPEIIYMTVNKRVGTRFFDNSTKDPRNAREGSVIFDQFARNNTMDFHLISQHVQNADGTATPTQYRIAFRNRFSLSEAALAQFTYEQCHNYYNWAGSVRIPAVLQFAGKLSKLVGEKVRENVFKIGKKKRYDKKEPTYKFIDSSSVSSIGQETIKLMNDNNLSFSMNSSFSLFNNNQISLGNSFNQSNMPSSYVSSSNVSSSIIMSSNASKNQSESKDLKQASKGGKRQDQKKDYDNKDFSKRDFSKSEDSRKNETIDLTVEKGTPKEKPDRSRQIVDTFFFL